MQGTKKGQANTKKNKSKKTIDLDNEIIIGLNTVKPNKPSKKKNQKTKVNKQKKPKKKQVVRKINKKDIIKKTNHKTKKIAIVILLFVIGLVFLLLSDLFNCKEIVVIGNSKITKENIINLSNIKENENIFKINKIKAKKKIKENPYINDVKIKRKLNGNVEIIVEERTPTFIITCENGCMVINNQGYILEVLETPLELPTIMGLRTDLSSKNIGERLDVEDLKIIEKVIQITDVAERKGIKPLITYINVANPKDIYIYMDAVKKTIYLGDGTNTSKKIDRAKIIMENEGENEGEIFVQDIEHTYFREKV